MPSSRTGWFTNPLIRVALDGDNQYPARELSVTPSLEGGYNDVIRYTITSNLPAGDYPFSLSNVTLDQIVTSNVSTESSLTGTVTLDGNGDGEVIYQFDKFYEYDSNVNVDFNLSLISPNGNYTLATSPDARLKQSDDIFEMTGGTESTLTGIGAGGGYRLHVFDHTANTESYNVTVKNSTVFPVEYLLVGRGGDGGGSVGSAKYTYGNGNTSGYILYAGAGGGGGGFLQGNTTSGNFALGPATLSVGGDQNDGNSVLLGNIIALKGGRGAGRHFEGNTTVTLSVGESGGSGGGAIDQTFPPYNQFFNQGNVGLGTPGSGSQGFSGGYASQCTREDDYLPTFTLIYGGYQMAAGGGGGASAVGANAQLFSATTQANQPGGNGGAGQSSDITGNTVIYAGGGGGGGVVSGPDGNVSGLFAGAPQSPYLVFGGSTTPGGSGGGGAGGWNSFDPVTEPFLGSFDGTNGLGGGGGGGGITTSTSASHPAAFLGLGGSGGAGVVIIRYLTEFRSLEIL